MSEIVISEGAPSADFQAGVATVVAAQAVDEAAQAEVDANLAAQAAMDAAGEAGAAAQLAAAAAVTADGVDARVDDLTELVLDGFAAISQALAGVDEKADVAVDLAAEAGAPPIVTPSSPAAEEPKPARAKRAPQTRQTAFGQSPFFRGRA